MTCKDNCLHYEVCAQFSKADGANHEYYDFSNQAEKCECFKDRRSRGVMYKAITKVVQKGVVKVTVEEVLAIVGFNVKVKLISSYNGKVRAATKDKAKKFNSYEVYDIVPKIKVNNDKYCFDTFATPYLEINIHDYKDWEE